jgi:hypothetical protein
MLDYRIRAGVHPCLPAGRQTLAIAGFKKIGVKKDLTLLEVPVLPGNAWCQVPEVPLQGFSSSPALLRYLFSSTGGFTRFENCGIFYHLSSIDSEA